MTRAWCCMGMEAAFADRADRTIFVYAEAPTDLAPHLTFWIAMRSVRQDDLTRLPVLVSEANLPITISTRKPILFCPWCGIRLHRYYRERFAHLVDHAVAREFAVVPSS